MVKNGCERDRDNSCKVVSILCMIGDESTSKPGKHVAAMAAMNPVFSRILNQHARGIVRIDGCFPLGATVSRFPKWCSKGNEMVFGKSSFSRYFWGDGFDSRNLFGAAVLHPDSSQTSRVKQAAWWLQPIPSSITIFHGITIYSIDGLHHMNSVQNPVSSL